MERCFVCGATPVAVPACTDCSTSQEVLTRLHKHAGRQRFLFGSVKPEEQKAQAVVRAKKPARKPRRAPAPQSAPIVVSAAAPVQDTDIIRNRDSGLPTVDLPTPPRAPLRLRTAAHLMDVGLCMALNFWILRLILWASGRSMQPLVNFSLIPLGFVLLSFTVLYFWLFLSLFGKSLGRVVLDRLARGPWTGPGGF